MPNLKAADRAREADYQMSFPFTSSTQIKGIDNPLPPRKADPRHFPSPYPKGLTPQPRHRGGA